MTTNTVNHEQSSIYTNLGVPEILFSVWFRWDWFAMLYLQQSIFWSNTNRGGVFRRNRYSPDESCRLLINAAERSVFNRRKVLWWHLIFIRWLVFVFIGVDDVPWPAPHSYCWVDSLWCRQEWAKEALPSPEVTRCACLRVGCVLHFFCFCLCVTTCHIV